MMSITHSDAMAITKWSLATQAISLWDSDRHPSRILYFLPLVNRSGGGFSAGAGAEPVTAVRRCAEGEGEAPAPPETAGVLPLRIGFPPSSWFRFPERFTLQFDPMGGVHQPIEDAVCDRGITNLAIPLSHRILARQ